MRIEHEPDGQQRGKLEVDNYHMSQRQFKGLEEMVEQSNYNYSKLKKKEGKESYSTRFVLDYDV